MYRSYQSANTGGGIGGTNTGQKTTGLSSTNIHNKTVFLAKPGFKHSSTFGPGKRFLSQNAISSASKSIRRIPPPANVPSLESQQRRFAASHSRPSSESTQWNVKSNEKKPLSSKESLWGQSTKSSTINSTAPSTDFPDLKRSAVNDSSSSNSIQQRLAKAANSLSNWKVESVAIDERQSISLKNEIVEDIDQLNWLDENNKLNYNEVDIFARDEKIENEVLSSNKQLTSDTVSMPVQYATERIEENDISTPLNDKTIMDQQNYATTSVVSSSQDVQANKCDSAVVVDAEITYTSQPDSHVQNLNDKVLKSIEISAPRSTMSSVVSLETVNIENIRVSDKVVDSVSKPINYDDLSQLNSINSSERQIFYQDSNFMTSNSNDIHRELPNICHPSQTIADSFSDMQLCSNKAIVTPNMVVGNMRPISNDLYSSGNFLGDSGNVDPRIRQQNDKNRQQKLPIFDNRMVTDGILLSNEQIAAALAAVHAVYPHSNNLQNQQPFCFPRHSPPQHPHINNDIFRLSSSALNGRLNALAASNVAPNFNRSALLQQLIASNAEAFNSDQIHSHYQNPPIQSNMQNLNSPNQEPLHMLPDKLTFSSHIRNPNTAQACILNTAINQPNQPNQPSTSLNSFHGLPSGQLFCSSFRPWTHIQSNAAAHQNILHRDLEFLSSATNRRSDSNIQRYQWPNELQQQQHHQPVQQPRYIGNNMTPQQQIFAAARNCERLNQQNPLLNNRLNKQQIFHEFQNSFNSGDCVHSNLLENMVVRMRTSVALNHRNNLHPSINAPIGQHSKYNMSSHPVQRRSSQPEVINADQIVRQLQDLHLTQQMQQQMQQQIQQQQRLQHQQLQQSQQIQLQAIQQHSINQPVQVNSPTSVQNDNPQYNSDANIEVTKSSSLTTVSKQQIADDDDETNIESETNVGCTEIRQDLDGTGDYASDLISKDVSISEDNSKLNEVKTYIFTPTKFSDSKRNRLINNTLDRRATQNRSRYGGDYAYNQNDIKQRIRKSRKQDRRRASPSDRESYGDSNQNSTIKVDHRKLSSSRKSLPIQQHRKSKQRTLIPSSYHRVELDKFCYYDDTGEGSDYDRPLYSADDKYFHRDDIPFNQSNRYMRYQHRGYECEDNLGHQKNYDSHWTTRSLKSNRSVNRNTYRNYREGRNSELYNRGDYVPTYSKFDDNIHEPTDNSNKLLQQNSKGYYQKRNYGSNNRKSGFTRPVQEVRPVVSADVHDDIVKSWDPIPTILQKELIDFDDCQSKDKASSIKDNTVTKTQANKNTDDTSLVDEKKQVRDLYNNRLLDVNP